MSFTAAPTFWKFEPLPYDGHPKHESGLRVRTSVLSFLNLHVITAVQIAMSTRVALSDLHRWFNESFIPFRAA